MPADPKAITARYRALREAEANHFKHCDEMAQFVAQSRVGIVSQRSPGERQNKQVYDATTHMATELLANFIASASMNPSQKWGAPRPRLRDAPDEILEWYEDAQDRILSDFANSMFYAEGPESLVDWCGFGTGCLITDEAPQPEHRTIIGWRGSHWEAHKTGRFVIAEGPDGLVDTVMYEKTQSAAMLKARFTDGRELGALPENVKKALTQGQPDKAFQVLHAIFPRPKADRQFAAGARKMPFVSAWIELESKTLLRESGYLEFPGAVPRYTKTPGERMGRGRGHIAFPDTWSLNKLKQMSFEDLALKQKPPILHAHDSVIGTLRLVPGGPTSVQTRGRPINEVIAPFQTGSHPEVSQLNQEDMRKTIRQIFFIDQILMLLEVNKSEMTAFEFAKKLELLFQLIGPVYGRLRKEFLERIWLVKFNQMFEAGALAPEPPGLTDEAEYDIVFENPLERAQRSGDIEAILMAWQDMIPMLQVAPEVKDWWGMDETMLHIMRIRGVPPSVTNSEAQVKRLRESRQAQVEQEEQAAQAAALAEAGGKVAPLVTALQGGRAR